MPLYLPTLTSSIMNRLLQYPPKQPPPSALQTMLTIVGHQVTTQKTPQHHNQPLLLTKAWCEFGRIQYISQEYYTYAYFADVVRKG